MIRLTLALTLSLFASPLWAADSKEKSCRYQGDVVAAIQKARLDRVKEEDVASAVAATNPTWPDNYSAAIPGITGWVYQQKRRVIRKSDLGAELYQSCFDNWDAIREQRRKLKN